MPNTRYVHCLVNSTPIRTAAVAPELGKQIGVLQSEYDVREYWDLRTQPPSANGDSTSTSPAIRAYSVSVRQRISIYNSQANSFGSLEPVTEYSEYPILVVQQIVPDAPGLNFYLEEYSPKTLNAAINTSLSNSTDTSQGASVQHTAGSSNSVTNSFECSESVGFFGGDPTGSVSAGFSHSETQTTEHSLTTGQTSSKGSQSGAGSSMTIKDWASYAFLDSQRQSPGWVWGQEYPWNVIAFRSVAQGSSSVSLPQYVKNRLAVGNDIFPPSDISQFGLDFVASAHWVFYVDGPIGEGDETAKFTHKVCNWVGTHNSDGAASLDILCNDLTIDDKLALNLPLLALDPITKGGAGNGALVGFAQAEFITPRNFKTLRLKSGSNNLYITQVQGFDQWDSHSDPNSVLTAHPSNTRPAMMTIQFKITDPNLEMTLYFKHWKLPGDGDGYVMNVWINQDVNHLPTVVRHIDSAEDGNADDNITSVTLRKKNYTSTEFYDYLVMGVNTVSVTIQGAGPGYALRVVAIG